MRKFFYVKRNDDEHGGSIVEIPELHLEMTLRQHPTWRTVDMSDDMAGTQIVAESPKKPSLQCPLCGTVATSEHGLKVHKARKHG